MSKMEGITNFSRHLLAVRNRDCWVKIIDVVDDFQTLNNPLKQKQFDVKADRKCIFHFQP